MILFFIVGAEHVLPFVLQVFSSDFVDSGTIVLNFSDSRPLGLSCFFIASVYYSPTPKE